MESNRGNNYDNKQQHPQKAALKCKLNDDLAYDDENDEQLAEECQEELQTENCSKRNRQNAELDLELNSELENGNFHNNDHGFASFCWSTSQIASRIELPNLLLPQADNSAQIHCWIGMGFLFYVPTWSTHKEDGLNASNNTYGQILYAEKGFPISVANSRMDNFPGTICYYYELKTLSGRFSAGFSHGGFVIGECVDESNYVIATISTDGRQYEYTEVPVGARPEPPNVQGNVFGCGLLMDPDNKVTTFFTLNGILLGKQISISPSVDHLFPTVLFWESVLTLEANFGDNLAKPFAYDIKNCPGMELDWI